MTLDEFYVELDRIRHKYKWQINHKNNIRGKLIDSQCDCCRIDFCPITAVAREKYNQSNPDNDNGVSYSAEKLNLQMVDALTIIMLADNTQDPDNKIRRLLIK